MIRHGILLLDNKGSDKRPYDGRVAGLSLLERGIRTMVRAGLEHILVIAPADKVRGLEKIGRDLGIRLEHCDWDSEAPAGYCPAEGSLLLQAEYIHHHSSLTDLLQRGLRGRDLVYGVDRPAQISLRDNGKKVSFSRGNPLAQRTSTGAFLCASALFSVADLLTKTVEFGSFLQACSRGHRCGLEAVSPELWHKVENRESARRAKEMLFEMATKKTSGFVARRINIPISVPISKLLVETGVSPNIVTFFLVFPTSLLGAWLIAQTHSYGHLLAAGFFWQLASILDGCDGEIARVKLSESRLGAWFDTLTDNLAYLCGYGGLLIGMYGLYAAVTSIIYPGISAIAALGLILVVLYFYAHTSGTGSLQGYLADLSKNIPDTQKDIAYTALTRYGFILKRDFLSLFVFFCLAFNLFELLYWSVVTALHGAAIGAAVMQYKMMSQRRTRLRFSRKPISQSVADAVR